MPIQSFAISSTISIQIVAFSIIISNATTRLGAFLRPDDEGMGKMPQP